jgi:phosphonate transport system substrate-binding protein
MSLRGTLALLALLFALPGASAEEKVYTFGVVPQSGPTRAAKDWTPILRFIEERARVKLQFATTRNIPTYAQRLEKAKYDFAYVNPTDYVKFADEEGGYRPIARPREVKLKGIVVVRKDSPYEKLEDLRKQDIAFPANAFAAEVIPMAILRDKGIEFNARRMASHESVYRAVATGRTAAGGGVVRSFNSTAAEYRDQLRVLWTSDTYSPHALVAHARVPAEVVKAVTDALIDMDQDPIGRKLLGSIAPKGLDYGKDEDWDDIRELDI